jgi:hypothetical protein
MAYYEQLPSSGPSIWKKKRLLIFFKDFITVTIKQYVSKLGLLDIGTSTSADQNGTLVFFTERCINSAVN